MSDEAIGTELRVPERHESRRDFLYLTAGATGAVGAAAAIWPLIDSMNPAADVLAVSSTEADLAPIEVGQRITVMWRGSPVFIGLLSFCSTARTDA